ncbi:MAG: glycosyltransferase family 39 protein [Anaerolineales bacterium]|nr:glycosyltransferase family 39 protein [Anaerolineales bacterium]
MKNKPQIFVMLLLPLAFTAGMLLCFPFRYRFEFDFDEGINLIKAMMTLKGFELYSEVWSDQPPVFNAILTLWFRLLGMKVNAGRILVLGFSTLLLISAMRYLQRFWGIPHAILGMITIVTLPFYTTLSVSVMIGLPSIAFALLSFVGLARWHQNNSVYWLIFSAVFLALSVMTKIWTVILAPIFLAGIFFEKAGFLKGKANLRDSIRPIMTWSLGFILVAGMIVLFVIRPIYVTQLVSTHLAAGETDIMQSIAAQNSINSYLDDSIALYLLSLFGVIIAIRSKAWHALYLVAWALAAYLLLLWIVPSWHHHQLLITIPAALLGSIAMGAAVVDLFQRIRASRLWTPKVLPSAAILLLSVFFAFQRLPPTLERFRFDLPNFGTFDPADQADFEIVAIMRNYADQTNIVFTDRPMYAFRSGIPVHPYLAVITKKRYVTGQLSQEEIFSILIATKPEQVILSRFHILAVQEYMEIRNFIRVDSSPRSRHYLKGEIYDKP